MSERSAPTGLPWTDLALLFLASRLVLLAIGLMSTQVMGSGLAVQKGNLLFHRPGPPPLEIWARWDSEWYLLIAEEGYAGESVRRHFEGLPVAYEPAATAGFLPLYPWLIRALAPIVGGLGAGVLVSNACLFVSLALLYRLTWRETGGGAGGRTAGLAACAALLAFPTSLFLSAVYAESLFLALSLATLDLAGRRRLASAGLAAGAAALTRPFGVLLTIPLMLEWRAARRDGAAPGHAWVWGLVPAIALSGFMVYCARAFGDPMAFVARQSRWRGAMSGPWRAFTRWWEAGPAAHGAHDSTLELMFAIFMLAMLPMLVRHLRPPFWTYAALAVLLPLCSTLWSFGRFALTVFPVFMMLGSLCAQKRWRLPAGYGLIAPAVSGLLMALYASWWWAG